MICQSLWAGCLRVECKYLWEKSPNSIRPVAIVDHENRQQHKAILPAIISSLHWSILPCRFCQLIYFSFSLKNVTFSEQISFLSLCWLPHPTFAPLQNCVSYRDEGWINGWVQIKLIKSVKSQNEYNQTTCFVCWIVKSPWFEPGSLIFQPHNHITIMIIHFIYGVMTFIKTIHLWQHMGSKINFEM